TELVHQIESIKGAVPLSGEGPTLNLTMLKAGERPNIIPDAAEATFSLRVRTLKQRDEALATLRAAAKNTVVPDTSVTVAADTGYPPLIQTPQVDALAARAQSVGTPALDGLGLVGGDYHTDKEWIDLTSLTPRLYLFTRLLMEMGANPPKR